MKHLTYAYFFKMGWGNNHQLDKLNQRRFREQIQGTPFDCNGFLNLTRRWFLKKLMNTSVFISQISLKKRIQPIPLLLDMCFLSGFQSSYFGINVYVDIPWSIWVSYLCP